MKFWVLLAASLLASGVVAAQSHIEPVKRSSKIDPVFVAAHNEALRRARVWFAPSTSISDANLQTNDAAPDGFREDEVVTCRFKVEGVAGATPKFVCELPDGDDIKVKYGRQNAEIYTEVLSTRLFNALGFPADRMYPVERVRCYGCSADPFKDLQCLTDGGAKEQCFPAVDYKRPQDFDHVVIERSVEGRRIETTKERGWSWKELALIDPKAGGSPRAQVDALRLLAVFIGHWDNKGKNQRLLCLGEDDDSETPVDAPCTRPVAMVQDLGATFGPDKLNLAKWSATPVWSNAAQCVVSMRALPYGGSTFADAQISEEGRVFLGNLLQQLSAKHIRGLFLGARVSEFPHPTPAGANVNNWVKAFQKKVDAIFNRPPCPA